MGEKKEGKQEKGGRGNYCATKEESSTGRGVTLGDVRGKRDHGGDDDESWINITIAFIAGEKGHNQGDSL